jgi:hypothetical protein
MRSRTTTTSGLWLVLVIVLCGGCARWSWSSASQLPSRHSLVLDQLVIFSDSALPQHHRLLDELRTQRSVLSTKLSLPVSDEPIHVYLFPTAERLESYLHVHYPTLPNRRAFFVESDTRLTVYAYWGDRVAEDLRHEVAHGYLHAVVPGLPLWLDEGLAEYFEVPRGLSGVNRPHLDQLTSANVPDWKPNLERLESLSATGEMTQADYAESWAWVHFLLESSPERQDLLRGYLRSLGKPQRREPLSQALRRADSDYAQHMLEHLAVQRQALQ